MKGRLIWPQQEKKGNKLALFFSTFLPGAMSGKPIEDGAGKFDKFTDEPDSKESDSPIKGMYHTVCGFCTVFHKGSNQM